MELKLALASAVALMAGVLTYSSEARAQQSVGVSESYPAESVSILSNDAAKACSDAAAVAAQTGHSNADGLTACGTAIHGQPLSTNELAATYLNRGVLLMARDDYGQAVSDFNQAISLRGDLSEGFADRGAAYAAQHRYNEAIADFSQALATKPARPEIVYFNRALAREDLGDLKGAYLDYHKAAELDASWEQPKNELLRFKVGHAAIS